MPKKSDFLNHTHQEATSLSNLYVFIAVADAGHFSRAAKSLNMPLATTSRRIAQLEQKLQTVLFQRNTRHVSLTKEGELFYEHIQPILSAIDDAFNLLSHQASHLRGLIRLTAPVDFIKHCLSDIISNFMQKNPEIRLQMQLSPNHINLVSERMDLAIRFGQLPDSNLYAQHLFDMPMQLFAASSYLNQHPTITQVEMLKTHNFIQLETKKQRNTLELFSINKGKKSHVSSINIQGNFPSE